MKKHFLAIPLLALLFLMNGCKKDDKSDPVSDFDGNTYQTIRIGDQVWMAENLRSTKLNDGTDIPLSGDAETWSNLTTPSYCWYNNDESSFKSSYGALYNGYAIETGKICPAGWHIPEKHEWKILVDFLGDSLNAGGRIKEAGTEHWSTPNEGADNSSGFTALPSGIRYFEGTFAAIAYSAYFWTMDTSGEEQWYAGLYYADAAVTMNHRSKKHGFSVRCLKD